MNYFAVPPQQKLLIGVGVTVIGAYAISSWLYGARVKQANEPAIVRGQALSGCAPQIHHNMQEFLSKCQREQGDIFTLRMGNEAYTTFIMDNHMMKRVLYHKRADWSAVSERAKLRFGLTQIAQMPNGMNVLSDALHVALAQQSNLAKLTRCIQDTTATVMAQIIADEQAAEKWVFANETLNQWLKRLVVRIELNVLFGPLFANDAQFIELYFEFEKCVPLRLNGEQKVVDPAVMNRLLNKIQSVCDAMFAAAAQQHDEKEEDNAHIPYAIQMVTDFCKKHSFCMQTTRNQLIVELLWASLSNSVHTMTWMVYHILSEPQCFNKIMAELQLQSAHFDIEQQSNCDVVQVPSLKVSELRKVLPSLCGVLNEVFRFYGQSNVYRYLAADITVSTHDKLRTYHLRKGDWVAGCCSFLHRNEAYFKDAHQFQYNRFVDDDEDTLHRKTKRRISRFNQKKAKNLFTFGSRCVGRHLAENLIVILCGFLFSNFEFQILDNNATKHQQCKVPRIGFIGAFSIADINYDDDLSFKWRRKSMAMHVPEISDDEIAMYQSVVYGNDALLLRQQTICE